MELRPVVASVDKVMFTETSVKSNRGTVNATGVPPTVVTRGSARYDDQTRGMLRTVAPLVGGVAGLMLYSPSGREWLKNCAGRARPLKLSPGGIQTGAVGSLESMRMLWKSSELAVGEEMAVYAPKLTPPEVTVPLLAEL
jgi:hypothetical protein